MPASIPETDLQNWRTYNLCLPVSNNAFSFESIVLGFLVQLTYKYFWDGSEQEKEDASNIGMIILNKWLDQGCNMNCEDVANCIENNSSVQTALDAWFGASRYASMLDKFESQLNATNKAISPAMGYTCQDYYFNALKAIIVELDDQVLTMFESIETATNALEIAQMLGEQISEFLDSSGFANFQVLLDGMGASLNLVNLIQEGAFEEYSQSATLALFDQIACEFFCTVQNYCEYRIQDFLDWIEDELALTISPDNIFEVFDIFIENNWSDRDIVLGAFWLQLKFALLMNKFGGFFNDLYTYPAITRLNDVIKTEILTPNQDHLILCDCYQEFDVVWLAVLPLTPPTLNTGDTLVSTKTLNDGAGSFIGYGEYLGGSTVRTSSSKVTITHSIARLVNSISFYTRVNGGGTATAYIKNDAIQTNYTPTRDGVRRKHTRAFPTPTLVTTIELFVTATQSYSGAYIEGIEIDYA